VVHVDDGYVRLPFTEDGRCLSQTARGSDDEEPMVEREFYQVHDQLAIVEHERSVSLD
jgi:hypothetical protein